MKSLLIEPSKNTPFIEFDKTKNLFKLIGSCFPEDVVDFFEPVMAWIKKYISDPNPMTEIHIQFKYLSSNSLKQVLMFLKTLEPLAAEGRLKIKWFQETIDEDMQEHGEILEQLSGLPFEFIMIEDL